MPRPTQRLVTFFSLIAVCSIGLTETSALAATGQEDLDRATEAKLAAATLADLDDVIRLCESAIEKGLDEADLPFANELLSSTLEQRGTARVKLLVRVPSTDPKWSGLRKDALADFEKCVELNPKRPEPFFFIAQLNLLPSGDPQRAAEALDLAIELPTEEPASRLKALLLRSSLEKDPKKKMADLDEAVRLVPHNAVAWRTRGLLRARQDEMEGALEDLDKAIELRPTHVPTLEVKAAVLAQMKRYDDAMVCLDRIEEIVPGSILPLLQKAKLHVAQENFDAALHELNRAASSDSNNNEVLMLRAGVYQRQGDVEKALADVDRILARKPGVPSVVRFRASILANADRIEEAIAQLKSLQQSLPQDVSVLLQLGVLYAADKQFDRAIESYSAVLKQHPDHWIALRARGDTLLNLGKHDGAIADFRRALKTQPKDSGLLNNLAWVLATSPSDELRDGPRAVELATEACEATKYEQAHIVSTLAAAYAETGDFESALKWSGKAVEISDDETLEALKKELESYRAGKPWRERLETP